MVQEKRIKKSLNSSIWEMAWTKSKSRCGGAYVKDGSKMNFYHFHDFKVNNEHRNVDFQTYK
jgi:hypothetical protein